MVCVSLDQNINSKKCPESQSNLNDIETKGNWWYITCPNRRSFKDARSLCIDLTGYLAEPRDEEVAQFLSSNFKRGMILSSTRNTFIQNREGSKRYLYVI